MTDTITMAKFKDIQALAKRIPSDWSLCELFDGTSRAKEAEVMVAQTLHACVLNHKAHGVAFSWRGERVFSRGGGGIVDNGTAYGMLLKREYFVEEERDGKTIIFVTQKLVDLLEGHLAK